MFDKHEDIIARVLSFMEFNKSKIQLQLVSRVWQRAVKLYDAHPSASFTFYNDDVDSVKMLNWLEKHVTHTPAGLTGLACLTKLCLTVSNLRSLQSRPLLPNLIYFELIINEPDTGELALPFMPNLKKLDLTACHHPSAGHFFMRNQLMDFPSLSRFAYSLEDNAMPAAVPIIKVPPNCEVYVEMQVQDVLTPVVIPPETRNNLQRLSFSLNSNSFPDLRACDRLQYLDIWLNKANGMRLFNDIHRVPDNVRIVRLVCDDIVAVQNRDGFSQHRFYNPDCGWCTYIMSDKHPSYFPVLQKLYDTDEEFGDKKSCEYPY